MIFANVHPFFYTEVTYQTKKYSLVLEYADSGTLNSYLDKNFGEFNWSDKYHLALQLATAVEFLHDEGIIHLDLVIYIFTLTDFMLYMNYINSEFYLFM